MEKSYPIQGMACASCAAKIEQKLGQLEGVLSANVNLVTESASINFDPQQTNESVFQKTVSDLGYQLQILEKSEALDLNQVQNFEIQGMSCASCAAKIEHTIKSDTHVQNASVNFATETLTVIWKDKPYPQELVEKVESLGYEANLVLSADQQLAITQARKDAELKRDRQKVVKMVLFTLPLFVLTMGPMIGMPLPRIIDAHHSPLNNALLQLVLTSPVLWIGRSLYIKGFKALLHGAPNMDSLGAIGTSAAYIQGFVMTLGLLLGLVSTEGHPELYFETAAVILTLMTLGKYLEDLAKGRTSAAIKNLMDLTPDLARRILDNGQVETVPLSMIQTGDIIQIRPGDRLGVDGVITQGTTTIDESMLTGESLPVEKTVGDSVTGGSLNKNGAFTYKVTKIGQETLLAQIIRLVQEAQGKKANIAKLADQISLYFVPAVMILSLITAILWMVFTGDLAFSLKIFISILIIACPCALGLATPTAIMVGTGIGAQNGILFKNGAALEQIHQANTILLDKTGTITLGQPKVTDFISLDHVNDDHILSRVASIENYSEHPLARAIVDHVNELGLATNLAVDDFTSITGKGVTAKIHDQDFAIGNQALLESLSIDWKHMEQDVQALASQAKTPMYVAVDNQLVAIIAVSDPIKDSSKSAIENFRKLGLKVYMVTGDNEKTAQAIAKTVGIEQVYSQVLPEEKSKVVQALKDEGNKVIMVGDGINDAPALALADIGVAIGSGTDIAIESADTILMKDDLKSVTTAIKLSHATLRNIKQNLFWAFIYNLVGIPLAMGLIYALFNGPLLDPMFAAIAMSFSSISVLLNALRLKLFKA